LQPAGQRTTAHFSRKSRCSTVHGPGLGSWIWDALKKPNCAPFDALVRTGSSTKNQPLRLTRRGGTWSLEFTRLVAVDDHVMRPERRRVAATTDALRNIAPSCPPARVREAEELMGQVDDGSERVFELAEEGWSPAPSVTHSQRPLARAEASALVTELQAQLLGLRTLYDALLARVVVLEQGAHRGESVAESRPIQKVLSRRDMLVTLQGGNSTTESAPSARVDAHQATAAAVPLRQAAAPTAPAAPPAAPAPAAPAPPPEASAEGHVPPGTPRLALPSQADVVGCMQMLAADVPLKPENGLPPSDLSAFLVARLVGESNDVLGLLLVNQQAQAMLGGGLLGVPMPTREEQGLRGLDQDTSEALNEVCNNLGGLVNRANPKCYTRLSALEGVSAEAFPWLMKPGKKLGFSTPANGLFWLVAR
jgi:hypothetical protein